MRDAGSIDATIAAALDGPMVSMHEPTRTISGPSAERAAQPAGQAGPLIRRLGYEELAVLGEGGLGVVLLARQQAFDRAVAIKRLKSAVTREDAMRFYAEAVVSAQLEHPNIVPVHDILSDRTGRLSLVMKRVGGRSWRSLLEQAPQPWSRERLDDQLEILLKVCDAVGFAHSRGIVHRDLKPENVHIGDHGEVVVMDWGCAVAFGDVEQHPAIPRVEDARHISGTPAYMPPEMVVLEPNRMGPASDIYLLGAILYELLTGKRPHPGGAVQDVLRAAALNEVLPPQEAAPDRDLPHEVAAIAMAALTTDPDERTPSVAAFAESLRDYRHHAQALELADIARRRLAEAARMDSPTRADERLRRACAAIGNALELRPTWTAGQALHAEALLAWGHHCLATGGHTQAQALAGQAVSAARQSGRNADEQAARKLLAKATAAQGRARSQTARTRWLAGISAAALILVAIAASVGYVEVAAAERRTRAALDLERRTDTERIADQKRYAPALVAQARNAILARDAAGGLANLDGAVAFDPGLLPALGLRAEVLAALGRRVEAAAAAELWAHADPRASEPPELAELCGLPEQVSRARIGPWLLQHQQPVLANLAGLSRDERLAGYRAQIELVSPGSGKDLQMWEGGGVGFPPGITMNTAAITDLSALRGLPFTYLRLNNAPVSDASPLAGMPLEFLEIAGTQLSDLSPLRGAPLTRLNAASVPKLDLRTCAWMRLRELYAPWNPQLADLSPLRGMPLSSLVLDGASVGDLSPLAGMPLEVFAVSGSFSDLRPLGQAPLVDVSLASAKELDLADLPPSVRSLGLRNTTVAHAGRRASFHLGALALLDYRWTGLPDLSALDLSQLSTLSLATCYQADLSAFARCPLRKLVITNCDVDLSPLAHARLEEIELRSTAAIGMIELFRWSPWLKRLTIEGRTMGASEYFAASSTALAPMDAERTAPAHTAPGLAAERLALGEHRIDALRRAAVLERTTACEPRLETVPENTGWHYSGYLSIPESGDYVLILSSDDGGCLYLHDRMAIDNDGDHAQTAKACSVHLAAGLHPVSIWYFNGSAAGSLRLSYAQGAGRPADIPASWWVH